MDVVCVQVLFNLSGPSRVLSYNPVLRRASHMGSHHSQLQPIKYVKLHIFTIKLNRRIIHE